MTSPDTPLRITVIGAGVVGCYLGGRLAPHADVTLVGRPHVLAPIRGVGLTGERGEGGGDRLHLPAESLTLAESPESVRRSDVVLVCTKAGSTAAATAEFVPFLRRGSLVVGLQNGLHSADLIRDAVDVAPVIGGILPRQLHRRFIGLGAGVAEEDPLRGSQRAQPAGPGPGPPPTAGPARARSAWPSTRRRRPSST